MAEDKHDKDFKIHVNGVEKIVDHEVYVHRGRRSRVPVACS